MTATSESLDRRRLGREVLIMTVIVWLAQFVLVVTQGAAFTGGDDPAFGWARAASSLAGFGACMGIHAASGPRPGRRTVPVLLRVALLVPLACLAVTLVSELVYLQFPDWFQEQFGLTLAQLLRNERGVLASGFSAIFFGYVWVFVAWTGLYASALHSAEVRDRDRRLAETEVLAHRAELLALRLQINPHFLFNSLNALAALIGLDRRAEAEQMVVDLSGFLRTSLTTSPEQKTTLRDEFLTQARYLDIERARFADRLVLEIGPLGEVEGAFVPSLILQPLLENAVRYAVQPSTRPVRVMLQARREGSTLIVVVEDHGAAIDASACAEPGTGIGLVNVRERLRRFYGDSAQLRTTRGEQGFTAEIRLPFEVIA